MKKIKEKDEKEVPDQVFRDIREYCLAKMVLPKEIDWLFIKGVYTQFGFACEKPMDAAPSIQKFLAKYLADMASSEEFTYEKYLQIKGMGKPNKQ